MYNVGSPFERIQVDILGPFPVTTLENIYLFVIVDCFTKWPEAIPLRSKKVTTIAEVLGSQVFSRHGIPLELHTDQGRNFESKLFKNMTVLLGVRKTRTTPLHPQWAGETPASNNLELLGKIRFREPKRLGSLNSNVSACFPYGFTILVELRKRLLKCRVSGTVLINN